MTADAKIGLLLGLMFIAIIAFLLNGLPDFLQNGSEGVIETAITPSPQNSVVVEQTVSRIVNDLEPMALRQVEPPRQVQVVADFSGDQPVITPVPQTVTYAAPVAPTPAPQTIELPSLPSATYTTSTPANYGAVTTTLSGQTHIVRKGENLAEIATRYYGSDAGNTRAVIQRLYAANRDVLESPDKIRVGDKLTIPPAGEMTAAQSASSTHPLLNKFKDVFVPAPAPKRAAPAVSRPAASVKEYTVQSGDRLWDIAEQYLGSGKRYNEIVRLNRLDDPDHIPAGTKLKIPAR